MAVGYYVLLIRFLITKIYHLLASSTPFGCWDRNHCYVNITRDL